MKSKLFLIGLATATLGLTSCEHGCHECHYDKDGTEVELGEKCDEELEDLEKNGIEVDGVMYEVHCHEH